MNLFYYDTQCTSGLSFSASLIRGLLVTVIATAALTASECALAVTVESNGVFKAVEVKAILGGTEHVLTQKNDNSFELNKALTGSGQLKIKWKLVNSSLISNCELGVGEQTGLAKPVDGKWVKFTNGWYGYFNKAGVQHTNSSKKNAQFFSSLSNGDVEITSPLTLNYAPASKTVLSNVRMKQFKAKFVFDSKPVHGQPLPPGTSTLNNCWSNSISVVIGTGHYVSEVSAKAKNAPKFIAKPILAGDSKKKVKLGSKIMKGGVGGHDRITGVSISPSFAKLGDTVKVTVNGTGVCQILLDTNGLDNCDKDLWSFKDLLCYDHDLGKGTFPRSVSFTADKVGQFEIVAKGLNSDDTAYCRTKNTAGQYVNVATLSISIVPSISEASAKAKNTPKFKAKPILAGDSKKKVKLGSKVKALKFAKTKAVPPRPILSTASLTVVSARTLGQVLHLTLANRSGKALRNQKVALKLVGQPTLAWSRSLSLGAGQTQPYAIKLTDLKLPRGTQGLKTFAILGNGKKLGEVKWTLVSPLARKADSSRAGLPAAAAKKPRGIGVLKIKGPDLVVQRLTGSCDSSGKIKLSLSIKNQGNQKTPGAGVRTQIKWGTSSGSYPQSFGTWNSPKYFTVGATDSTTKDKTGFSAGTTYYLKATVYSNNKWKELKENNNTKTLTVKCPAQSAPRSEPRSGGDSPSGRSSGRSR